MKTFNLGRSHDMLSQREENDSDSDIQNKSELLEFFKLLAIRPTD